MALKDKLTNTVIKLINKYGNFVVVTEIIIPDPTDYNTTTGKIPQTETPHNIKVYQSQMTTAQLNTGLYGIDNFNAKFVFDGDVTKLWLIDGAEIITLDKTSIQDGIIVWDAVCRK